MRGTRDDGFAAGPWGPREPGRGEGRDGGPRGPGGGRRHHPGGPFGFGGPDWPFEARGPRGFGGFGGFGRGGGRRPRGDVRAAVLVLLAEGPSNGYRIIGEVARRSDGQWKPSPGSVYPTLQQLQDEGLVEADAQDAKQFTLTEQGRRYVAEELADTPPPWEAAEAAPGREQAHQLRRQLGSIAATYQQIAVTGRPADLRRAGDVLEQCRRDLVAILAQDLRETPGS